MSFLLHAPIIHYLESKLRRMIQGDIFFGITDKTIVRYTKSCVSAVLTWFFFDGNTKNSVNNIK